MVIADLNQVGQKIISSSFRGTKKKPQTKNKLLMPMLLILRNVVKEGINGKLDLEWKWKKKWKLEQHRRSHYVTRSILTVNYNNNIKYLCFLLLLLFLTTSIQCSMLQFTASKPSFSKNLSKVTWNIRTIRLALWQHNKNF